MSTLDSQARLSADDRYELASRAMMHERRSRPAHLVAFGVLVFVIALLFLAFAWRHNSAAESKLLSNSVAAINVEQMMDQINQLELALLENPEDDIFQPIPDILTRITRIGEQVGLQNPIGLPRNTPPRTEGSARLMSYPYTVRDQSLELILEWIQQTQEQIPGLQAREVTINLNAQSWVVKVTLTRYERIQ
ncbi:MAG: hypothetical protein JJ974_01310 [Phycisphaerales bacterium]|nr:hypothetical protein [Phycisphaerales bacterium]